MFVYVLVLALFVLTAISLTFYRKKKELKPASEDPVFFRADPSTPFQSALPDRATTEEQSSANSALSRQRLLLLERAKRGEVDVLTNGAASRDWSFYREMLDCLVDRVTCQEDLDNLVSRVVSRSELRASTRLADCLIDAWKEAPERRSTSNVLHIAALSDDPICYHRAVETVIEYWRSGLVSGLTDTDLIVLIEHEYWVLAPEVRRSGDAFILKRALAGLRGQLAAAKPNVSS